MKLTTRHKTLPNSTSKSRFTAGYTYYDAPKKLEEQFNVWKKWPSNIDIILVDDGSQAVPAKEVIDYHQLNLDEEYTPNFRLFKVTRDLGFNSHGCRNLIAKYALTDWLAFFDIDHIMYPSDAARLKKQNFDNDPEKIYRHSCYYEWKQLVLPPPGHFNTFVIHKDLYWKAGGYDESFTGHHWGDREFFERIEEAGGKDGVTNICIHCNREGRHGIVTDKVDKTVYIDDENFWTPLGPEEMKKLKGTKKQRIDFPFIEVL